MAIRRLLLESGSKLLLQSGGAILLESSTAAAPDPGEGDGRYATAWYYPPSYLPPELVGGAAAGPTIHISLAAPADRTILRDIRARLDQSYLFSRVIAGAWPHDPTPGADDRPLAMVAPVSWFDSDQWDPVMMVRTLTVAVVILVAEDEVDRRHDVLGRLSDGVANLLDGQSLGGGPGVQGTIPALTVVSSGEYQVSRHPDQALALQVTCPYFLAGYAGRDQKDN